MKTAQRTARVVVVDDTPDIREVILLTLIRDGRFVVVGEAEDGDGAVALARDTQPDVVLLDLSMPGMDGIQAIPGIRRLAPDARIAVLSGLDSARMRQQALDAGAHLYLDKVVDLPCLGHRLASLCELEEREGPREGPRDGPPAAGCSAQRPLPESVEAAWAERMGVVAHELRTPVTVVLGFAATLRLLVERGSSGEEVLRAAEAIERNAIILSELTRSLADVGPADAGAVELQWFRVDLRALVEDTVEDLALLTSLHPVRVEVTPDLEVDADPLRVRQILTNLLVNAARYTAEGSPIDVSLRAEETHAVIAVRDWGPGIPPDQLEAVFEKFVRLREGVGGSGLGLHLSRRLAELHGGTLTAHLPPDGGCRFELRLPRR